MLKMQEITKIYRTDFVETHALGNFDLEVDKGEFIAVMGPSGSGKSTFLNITGLLDNFDSGRYILDETDVSRLSDKERSWIRNEKIGFIFQSFNLIPELNVFDNVDVPLRYRGFNGKERKERIMGALETVGLGGRTKHYPSQLSGGQQQRVAIARAIAGSPSLILADEPTGNLDSQMARQIMDLLEEINGRGTTIIMVSHDPQLSARAHRQIHLLDGKVVALEEESGKGLGQLRPSMA
jgi:putative ABC transport system ATP-binding protein